MIQKMLKWMAYFSAVGCLMQSLYFYNQGLIWWPSIMLGVCMVVMGLQQEGDI